MSEHRPPIIDVEFEDLTPATFDILIAEIRRLRALAEDTLYSWWNDGADGWMTHEELGGRLSEIRGDTIVTPADKARKWLEER